MADGAVWQNGPSGLPPSHPIGSPPATGRERIGLARLRMKIAHLFLDAETMRYRLAGLRSGPTGVASGSVQVHGPTLQAIPGNEHPTNSPRGVSLQTRHPSLTERHWAGISKGGEVSPAGAAPANPRAWPSPTLASRRPRDTAIAAVVNLFTAASGPWPPRHNRLPCHRVQSATTRSRF